MLNSIRSARTRTRLGVLGLLLIFHLVDFRSAFFVDGFISVPSLRYSFVRSVGSTGNDDAGIISFDNGEVGSGPNWIERATLSSDSLDSSTEDCYNVGVSGLSFETGPLSKRIFDTIMSSKTMSSSSSNKELELAFTVYAMEIAAKEAVKVALKQNGLQMIEAQHADDNKEFVIDSIHLLNKDTNEPIGQPFTSIEEAIGNNWKPGQNFDFVARQVPANGIELSLTELLNALDPDGALREAAKSANMTLPDEEQEQQQQPQQQQFTQDDYNDYDITSLEELANDCIMRTNNAPRGATTETNAFSGHDTRGYRIINRGDLLSKNGTGPVRYETLMHVMDAFVSHGALIVDMTDSGANFTTAKTASSMWRSVEKFFDVINDTDDHNLPAMRTISEETGSKYANVGYVEYDNGALQFLETRLHRYSGQLLPNEAQKIFQLGLDDNGDLDGLQAIKDTFDAIVECGKDIVRIAVAASSIEAGAFQDDKINNGGNVPKLTAESKACMAASLMTKELIDDGKPIENILNIESDDTNKEGSVSMSPHRFCRYTNIDNDSNMKGGGSTREIFGAHTDASFVTAVPVAAINGIEIYDEAEERWYRPEIKARKHWQKEQERRHESNGIEKDDDTIPWHANYVIFMPGEFLQLLTRNEVPASVHRVVATVNSPSRLSAPVLLRGRPGMKMDVERYLGNSDNQTLLNECDGMNMEKLHDAMQPTSK